MGRAAGARAHFWQRADRLSSMARPTQTLDLSSVGVDLGMNSVVWDRPPAVPDAMRITQRDRRLLTTVYDFGYLTTSMLALLFWGNPSSACYARLRLLHDAGFLERFRPRVARTDGSHEWIYRLTKRGWHDVVRRTPTGADVRFRPSKLTSIAYVEHDLQVSALVVHLLLLSCRANGWGHDDGLLTSAPFEVVGPRRGVVEPIRPVAGTVDERGIPQLERVRHELAVIGTVVPDATLVGTDSFGRRTAVMIEYDRTRRAHKQIGKLRRYDHFLASGWRTTRFSELDVEPLVLFVGSSQAQLPAFLRTADAHLTAWHGPPTTLRADAEHPGREQVAFTSRDRLFAADWRMLQVQAQPPSVRRTTSRNATVPSRAVTLDLSRLFRRELT
jgi:hypothetical protein